MTFYLVFVALLCLISCNYDTNEHFINPIPQPEPENAAISLGSPNDTVTVVEDVNLAFSLNTTYPHVATEVWFDNKRIFTLGAGVTSFPLAIAGYRSGYYSLKLNVITSPHTGSLADLEGNERMSSWKSFAVFIDKSTPEKPSITSIGAEDGTLRIRWNKSFDPSFEYYEIKKFTYSQSFSRYEIKDTIIVRDANVTFADDPAFIGGAAIYRLRVAAKGRFSEAVEQNYSSPWKAEFTYSWQDDANAKFSWRKNPYYNNISRIEYSRQGTPPEHITNKDDTTRIYNDPNFRFGKSAVMLLRVIPKVNPYAAISSSTLLFKGTACHPNFFYSDHVKARDEYFALKTSGDWRVRDSLFVFGQDKFKPIRIHTFEKRVWELQVNKTATVMYVLYEDELVTYDPVTFSEIKRYSFSGLPVNHRTIRGSKMTITDNGLALLEFYYNAVVDLDKMEIKHSSSNSILTISPDGSQLFVLDKRYLFDGTNYVNTNQSFFSLTSLTAVTHPSNDTLAVVSGTRFTIYNAASGAVVKQVTVDTYSQYDHENALLYAIKSPELKVIDLKNDQQKTIPVDFSNSGGFKIANKHLICPKGFYMRVD